MVVLSLGLIECFLVGLQRIVLERLAPMILVPFANRWGTGRHVISTAANHFHYPGQKAVESRPLIGTNHPPLV
jgi:hypothetical protein